MNEKLMSSTNWARRSSGLDRGDRRSRKRRLAAGVLAGSALATGCALALASPASAATPKLQLTQFHAGGTRLDVSGKLSKPGFVGIEVGRQPLLPGHANYSQQYGDFVAGANGGNKLSSFNLPVTGLDQHTSYWATIGYKVNGVQRYQRNLPLTTLTRHVGVHVSDLFIDDDGDEHGCGEVDAFGTANGNGFPFPYGSGWSSMGWTAQKDICTAGHLTPFSDVSVTSAGNTNVSVAVVAVDDDTVFGCSKSTSCGDNVTAEALLNVGPKAGGTETYTAPMHFAAYEGGGIGPAVGQIGVEVTGTYSVSYS
jgi:hypothetical protein